MEDTSRTLLNRGAVPPQPIVGKPMIDNRTCPAPTRNTATIELTEDRIAQITVKHVKIDGYATLELTITTPCH